MYQINVTKFELYQSIYKIIICVIRNEEISLPMETCISFLDVNSVIYTQCPLNVYYILKQAKLHIIVLFILTTWEWMLIIIFNNLVAVIDMYAS